MCCVFDPAEYLDDPGEEEERPIPTTDDSRTGAEEAPTEETVDRC